MIISLVLRTREIIILKNSRTLYQVKTFMCQKIIGNFQSTCDITSENNFNLAHQLRKCEIVCMI